MHFIFKGKKLFLLIAYIYIYHYLFHHELKVANELLKVVSLKFYSRIMILHLPKCEWHKFVKVNDTNNWEARTELVLYLRCYPDKTHTIDKKKHVYSYKIVNFDVHLLRTKKKIVSFACNTICQNFTNNNNYTYVSHTDTICITIFYLTLSRSDENNRSLDSDIDISIRSID